MPVITDKIPTYSNPYEFDMLMLEPVHEMMKIGIRVDQEEKQKAQQEAIEEWEDAQKKLDYIVHANKPLNVSSPKQVKTVLYGWLGMPKRTHKGSLTTNEEALRDIMAECRSRVSTLTQESATYRWMEGYLVCRYILNIRALRKQISSYLGLKIDKGELAGPAPFEDEDGRIRGTVSVGGTKTARFSHSKTLWGTGINQATVPRQRRNMYVADDGYEMAEFDLNRGESWVYSHLSEDPELLRIHLNGLDFHSETGALISEDFGSQYREVDWIIQHSNDYNSEFYDEAYMIRYVAKRVNHATSYRMRSKTGAAAVNKEADETGIAITKKEFDVAREKWLQKYFMIESWWNKIELQLSQTKTLVTPYGRRITFHGRHNDKTLREATAYVPQSTSVDYLNRGFLKTHYGFVRKGAWGLSVLAQTHDSILVQYRIEDREEAIPEIASALTSSLTINDREFSIPIEAKYGPSWGKMKDYSLG